MLVGHYSKPPMVLSADDFLGEMSEFRHIVGLDRVQTERSVYGCDLQQFPEIDEDLRGSCPVAVHLHIENNKVENLNLDHRPEPSISPLKPFPPRGRHLVISLRP